MFLYGYLNSSTRIKVTTQVIMYKLYSALTYFPSCTELLTHYLENPKSYTFTVQRCTSVYCSNILALRCTLLPEPKCITQNKTQRKQINFAKETKFGSGTNGLDNPALHTRGVNRAEISGPARKFVFGPARPAINIL